MDSSLWLTETFVSIQGESTWSGLPTLFIRLSGCNLRCSWCDTPYSFTRGTKHTLDQILEIANTSGVRHICITGGEPLLQPPIFLLMRELCKRSFFVSIETGGSLSIQEIDAGVKVILDIKCPASGMSHKNYWENLTHIKSEDEIKFVITDKEDYSWAKQVLNRCDYPKNATTLFSPEFNSLHPRTLTQWILSDHLDVRLNLQLHKYIWDPQTKGV